MTTDERTRLQEQLASVRKAIYNAEQGGQSYKIGSRQLTRVEYASLLAQEEKLASALAAEDNGTLFADTYAAFFEGR